MCGYQAAGAAPFVAGKMVDKPETVATAIRIGHPQSWDLAWNAQKESGGWFDTFTMHRFWPHKKCCPNMKVFCEPASATSLAGVIKDLESGKILRAQIVCTLTGNGLKDPDTAINQCASADPVIIHASLDAVKRAILDSL